MYFIKKNKNILLRLVYLVFLLSICTYAFSVEKTLIWITIDTESTEIIPLYDQVYTKIGGVECGISRMMDMFDKYNMKATFFFNVYEYKAYGEEKISKIAQYIHDRGHDVQLHPHPDWAYDKGRPALWQYSLDEQTKILEDGKNLLIKWIGENPIALRAGGYLADNNTLKAISKLGFLIDSSYFYQNETCKISDPRLGVNSPVTIDGLWEVPVTLYIRSEEPRYNILKLESLNRYRKIDIDWADYNDLESAISQSEKGGAKVITLFLHSFSFLDMYGKTVEVNDINKLDNVLKIISNNSNIEVVTTKDLLGKLNEANIDKLFRDIIPIVRTNDTYPEYIKRRFNISKKDVIISIIGGCVILLLVLIGYRLKTSNNER